MKLRARLAAAALAAVAGAGSGGPALAAGHVAAARPVRLAGAPAAGITTAIAGGPGRGPAWSVAQAPAALATGQDGAVYVGDGLGAVRRFGPSAAWESVVAGLGQEPEFFPGGSPHLGDGRLADRANVGGVAGLALDPAGDLLIADTFSNRVRVVAATAGTLFGRTVLPGRIYTVAGNGRSGYSGDGGLAVSSSVAVPVGIALDAAGNLIVAEPGNYRIRVVAASTGTFYGQSMAAGHIYTIAGNGQDDYFGDNRRGDHSGDGGPATAAEVDGAGIAVDGSGNVVIADPDGQRVRVVAASTGTFYGQPMTAGYIYAIAGDGFPRFTGDGGPATAGGLYFPTGVAIDASGNLVIADSGHDRVRVVAASAGTFYGQEMTAGDIYTIAGNGTRNGFSGNGGPATAAGLGEPQAVAFDSARNLLIAGGHGRVWAVAAASGSRYGRAMTAGHIYVIAGRGLPQSGNSRLARNAVLAYPTGITVGPGPAPNVVVYDRGQLRLVAAASGTFFGQAMTAGHIYAIAGTGTMGYSGDGGPATSAGFGPLGAVTRDATGNLVIADTYNGRIRVVAAADGTFYGVSMTAGDVWTVAGTGAQRPIVNGTAATSAGLGSTTGVAVDSAGNLVIADQSGSRICVVAALTGTYYGQAMTAGDIYTVAGTGTAGYSGDGGPATAATLNDPSGVAVDGSGNLVIADTSNYRIRVVAASAGTFYGQSMTAGNISTVAGTSSFASSGDGGPALSAGLAFPQTVTVGASRALILTQRNSPEIRLIAAAAGTVYGQPVTAGDIYGFPGPAGMPWPGIPAALGAGTLPAATAVDSWGDVFITDTRNRRIWETGG